MYVDIVYAFTHTNYNTLEKTGEVYKQKKKCQSFGGKKL